MAEGFSVFVQGFAVVGKIEQGGRAFLPFQGVKKAAQDDVGVGDAGVVLVDGFDFSTA